MRAGYGATAALRQPHLAHGNARAQAPALLREQLKHRLELDVEAIIFRRREALDILQGGKIFPRRAAAERARRGDIFPLSP